MRKLFVLGILFFAWSCGSVPQTGSVTTSEVAPVHASPVGADSAEPAIASDGKGGMTFKSRVLFSNNATSGTPSIMNNSVIAFATKDGNTQIDSLDGGGVRSPSLPRALYAVGTTSADRQFVAYVTKENGQNAVWLARL